MTKTPISKFQRLKLIQAELKAPKGQYNNFGKYKYRNAEDILEAVKPLLNKYDFTLTINDNVEQVGERYYVRAIVTLTDTLAETANSISSIAYAREEENKKGMDGSQVTGASSSYARKYALNGLFAIDDTKDSDTTNTGASKPQGRANASKTAQSTAKAQKGLEKPDGGLIAEIEALFKATGNAEENKKRALGNKNVADLDKQSAEKLRDQLKAHVAKQAESELASEDIAWT